MARVIGKSSGWSQAFERIVPVLATRGQTAELRLKLMVKDLDLACGLGMECGAPMLIANAVRSIVEAAANELGGNANWMNWQGCTNSGPGFGGKTARLPLEQILNMRVN
jgi:3-hydroxyisobutyrate dehydrogenase-like beta-hydroxyacid dehydrogenase